MNILHVGVEEQVSQRHGPKRWTKLVVAAELCLGAARMDPISFTRMEKTPPCSSLVIASFID